MTQQKIEKGLDEKAMLVKATFSFWRASKTDKQISQEVAASHDVQADAGRYTKFLIDRKAAAYRKLIGARNELEKFYKSMTLPWDDATGQRLLSGKNYFDFTEGWRKRKEDDEAAANAFCIEYQGLVSQALKSLKGMGNPEDYPSVLEVRDKFKVDLCISPLPTSGDFRVNLTAEEAEAIKADIEDRNQERQSVATQELWDRLYEVVSKMAETLGDPEKIFRNTLVTNVQDLAPLLTKLNITDDPRLEEMRRDVEAKLCRNTPQDLRELVTVRDDTAKAARDILDKMAGYMGGGTNAAA